MTAIHQQRRNNVECLVELLLSIYDKETPEGQRNMFENAVIGVSRGYSLAQQREIIEKFEKAIEEANNG